MSPMKLTEPLTKRKVCLFGDDFPATASLPLIHDVLVLSRRMYRLDDVEQPIGKGPTHG